MMMAVMLTQAKFCQRCENFTLPVYAGCLLTSGLLIKTVST